MKVSGPRPIDGTSARRATTRAGASGGAFHVDHDVGARPLTHAAPNASLTAVDTMLALQAVPDASTGRRRAVRRAADMLDLLDDIKIGLLEGVIPRGKLQGLLKAVQSRRDEIDDPGLLQVLDEVELRAQVELAKFGQMPLLPVG